MAERKLTSPAKSDRARTPVSASEDVSSFLEQVKRMPPAKRTAGERGRLIFAMDATMSRRPTWDRALQIQSEMFIETEKIGGLDVQLIYFRGFNECRASRWVSEPSALANIMTGVDCRGGNTQIGKVLTHIRREADKGRISAAIYVGDAMEENVDRLCQTAGEIGLLNVPLFMFQEGLDGVAEQAFREIARLTRGAYFRLDPSSALQLRELLSAVAVYATGGRQALADHSRTKGGTSRLLLEQLR
jgi:hypothetical protein